MVLIEWMAKHTQMFENDDGEIILVRPLVCFNASFPLRNSPTLPSCCLSLVVHREMKQHIQLFLYFAEALPVLVHFKVEFEHRVTDLATNLLEPPDALVNLHTNFLEPPDAIVNLHPKLLSRLVACAETGYDLVRVVPYDKRIFACGQDLLVDGHGSEPCRA